MSLISNCCGYEPIGELHDGFARCAHCAEMAQFEDDWFAELNIKTNHDFPPIPDRRFDWSAWEDGEEERGIIGRGPTEAEAIADLKTLLEDTYGK